MGNAREPRGGDKNIWSNAGLGASSGLGRLHTLSRLQIGKEVQLGKKLLQSNIQQAAELLSVE